MTITRKMLFALPVLAATLFTFPQASEGRAYIHVKSCDGSDLDICLYDWGDVAQLSCRDKFTVSPGGTGSGSCRKNWSTEDGPGCNVDANEYVVAKLKAGTYTIWQNTGSRSTTTFYRSGVSQNCNQPDGEYVISGSELSGCTPKFTIYGNPDRTGDHYTLENAKMSDMRDFIRDGGNMNDWPRSFHVESGKWEICEDINFGGHCISFHGPATMNLETGWSGNWDRAISSIKPLACE